MASREKHIFRSLLLTSIALVFALFFSDHLAASAIAEEIQQAQPILKAQQSSASAQFLTLIVAFIKDPTVAYLLFLVAFYGLFFEFAHPGHIIPGALGGLCLLLGLYAMLLLPINYAGLALLILGIILMVVEAFMSFYGLIAFAGTVAFVAGSVFLFIPSVNHNQVISWPLIGTMLIVNALFIFTIVRISLRSRLRQPVVGKEAMIGKIGVVKTAFSAEGDILILSEVWRAKTTSPVQTGQQVKVIAVDGLTVQIEPFNN